MDRKTAASLPALGVRLRLQDMALLMAEALLPHLQADPRRPLVFLNIAGGPAVDSLNAFIVLNKRQAGILSGREVSITVLDADDEGLAFGKAALAALSAADGLLHGTHVNFQHRPYDWANANELEMARKEAQARGSIVMCSSEGGCSSTGRTTKS